MIDIFAQGTAFLAYICLQKDDNTHTTITVLFASEMFADCTVDYSFDRLWTLSKAIDQLAIGFPDVDH